MVLETDTLHAELLLEIKADCSKYQRYKCIFLWLVELAEVHPTLPVPNTIIFYSHVGGIDSIQDSWHIYIDKIMYNWVISIKNKGCP